MDTKISIRTPELEVEFEGSEDFVREELRNIVEDVASLHVSQQHPKGQVRNARRDVAQEDGKGDTGPVAALADEIGVGPADVESAFAPKQESPYVRVEKYYWNAFKKNTPGGGPSAISSGALVGTLMCLWFDQIDRDGPTKEEVVEATAVANIRDKRIDRSMNNCDWLRVSGDRVAISPAQVDKAVRVARAFCLKKPIEEEE